jgi:hypothetical protein
VATVRASRLEEYFFSIYKHYADQGERVAKREANAALSIMRERHRMEIEDAKRGIKRAMEE